MKHSYLNLVKLKGEAKDQGKKALVLEGMVRGTIRHLLSEFACMCHVLSKDLDSQSAS